MNVKFVIKKYEENPDCAGVWNLKSKVEIRANEAIEKMARAICQTDDDGCSINCNKTCDVWKHSILHAIAALNALTED